MKRAKRQLQGHNALDLIEEATHLLRTGPAASLAIYYLGAIPFVLGLLFFWADMSRSPLAPQHIAEASFGVTVLFFWMKFCQAIFARRVRAQAAAETFVAPGIRRALRIFFRQSIIQPTGLFLMPLASLPILPFPWIYTFYQNATALDAGDDAEAGELIKKSWRQAKLWPRQNHAVLAILVVFAFCVFLNWATTCMVLPRLFKMLFGVESDFTKNPLALLNTTFFAAMYGLTYLCVDPIAKTVYALHCFYGESLESGEDLKAQLAPFIRPAVKTLAAVLILSAVLFPAVVSAESTNAPAFLPTRSVQPPELDHAIDRTIHESKYVWRMPREKIVEPEGDEGIFAKFFHKAGKLVNNCLHTIKDWVEKILKKLFPPSRNMTSSSSSNYSWMMMSEVLLYVLVAAVLIALAIFLLRLWRNRQPLPTATASEPIRPLPDIADENVYADQLPEDGWTKLARELLERGEFRLAMRAFYLASLAHLAARNLISIARFKSNREYERELIRRAHAIPNLRATFGDNISIFERVWYGSHEATDELVRQFAASVENLKANA